MRILVTGGAGFIGSHLVDELSKDKSNKITLLDSFYRGSLENIKQLLKNKDIRIIKGDVRDINSFKKIGKVDIVYHLAAQSNVAGSFFKPDYAFSSNVVGTHNALKYSSGQRVKRFVFSSSREVYGNPEHVPVDEMQKLGPINMYGATKVCSEALCRAFSRAGLNLTIMRIANSYGPRDKDRVIPLFIKNAKNNKNLELFGGHQVLDFIWVGDVVNAMIKASKNTELVGETANIGTGIGTSIEGLAKIIIKLTGSKSKIARKKARSFDVQRFISKSSKIKLKTTKLVDGLKKTIGFY